MALAKCSPFGHHCSTSMYPLLLQPQTHPPNTSRSVRIGTCCAHHQIKAQVETTRTKKKLKPSFFDQIRHKWSFKTNSPREKLPWQQQEEQLVPEEEKIHLSSGVTISEPKTDVESPVSEPVSSASQTRFVSAPWVHGNSSREAQLDSNPKISQLSIREEEENVVVVKDLDNEVDCDSEYKMSVVKIDANPVEISKDKETAIPGGLNSVGSLKESPVKANGVTGGSYGLPWKRNADLAVTGEGDRRGKRSNTELAESMIPEHELRRLRNVSLRMLERIKVGYAGITQALVDSIHEKWKVDEVVKLKFEEPHSLNMRRTHEILESRTGGLVIWRSGSSVVLFRGMTYKLTCVQSFTKQNQMQHSKDDKFDMLNVGKENSVPKMKPFDPDSTKHLRNLSTEELIDLSELNYLLDELGPRFIDWTGCEPLPVDADLLPPVVPDYKPPFRLLPYGIRHCLKDKEMTILRRLTRNMPPHFALGRNRELQGLAKAMVKLWEKSAIAKIAIKRGVLNTRNERMAEELKNLTGGTLLSRNKDFIVFYRGNDFLPPVVTDTLKERLKLADFRQDEEEQARQVASALMEPKVKASGGPLVAGTLAETMAATSCWGNKPGKGDLEEMMRDSALSKHASLVKHLEKKLVIAKRRLKRADIALAKVQKNLEPAELPSDLETITHEERFLFRKMGLSMKPYLLLGRRGLFDGTVENMHLHWKFRELVKIIVKGKTSAQVKQIAISLEAESGGVLVSLDKTTKGYAIIVYRGKNYQNPLKMRPENLLTRRQALARSIELQRREALKHHVMDLEERIELVKSELEEMKAGKTIAIDKSLYSRLDDACFSDDETEEDEADEAYLESYASGNDGNYNQNEFLQQRRPF
ncbi:hypothetical protein ACOSQ2_015385 [Xanthoceras sorbifolium]